MEFLLSLVVAVGAGLIIGLEREFRLVSEKDSFAGMRTFPLTSLLGVLVALVSQSYNQWLLVAATMGFMAFVALAYHVRSKAGHTGITTEISLVIAFVLGIMSALQMMKEAVAGAVVTATFLSLKGVFRAFIARVTEEELFAFIKFIVLSMLLLPFLPNKGYGPDAVLNPFDIGLVIVTMSLLSFVSYILMKVAGASRGLLLASFLGGLVSSTAVTWLFSEKSKPQGGHNAVYAAGIVLASSIMPLRVSLVSWIFVRDLFPILVIPSLLISATGLVWSLILWRNARGSKDQAQLDLGNPLSLTTVLTTTVLYVGVLLLVYYLNSSLGSGGLYLSGFISGFADVDAITIAMADVIRKSTEMAMFIVLIAIISNTIMKALIVIAKADKKIRVRVVLALSSIALTAGLYIAGSVLFG